MTRLARPGDGARLDARLTILAALTAVTVVLALLRRGATDFTGGVAVGLAVSLVIGWLVSGD